MMSLDFVIKVGGSLSRSEQLTPLCREIGRLGARHRLLVVPGGGDFADLVRCHYRRYLLDETTAHRMALLAMDQYGYLLGDLMPNSSLVADLTTAQKATLDGRVAILLPASLLIQTDPLPNSWDVTSDSIAAWVAGQVGSSQLVLLKDVDGLFTFDPSRAESAAPIPELSVGELAKHQGGVDGYLAAAMSPTKLDVWVINGRHPERLAELLGTGRTLGTHITGR